MAPGRGFRRMLPAAMLRWAGRGGGRRAPAPLPPGARRLAELWGRQATAAVPLLRRRCAGGPSPHAQDVHREGEPQAPAQRLAALARLARRRAALRADEWRDQASEYRGRAAALWRRRLVLQRRWTSWRQGWSGLSTNEAIRRCHAAWLHGIERFDEWFNAHFFRVLAAARQRLRDVRDGESPAAAWAKSPSRGGQGPFDLTAGLLVGAGAGAAMQGYTFPLVLVVWGVVRGLCRFVVQRLDADDVQGLFRFVPGMPMQRKAELFERWKHEVHTFRSLRSGDLKYADMSWIDRKGGDSRAMDPDFDYTPEELFDDAMTSLASHPRVRELLGDNIRPQSEPDKVVYRKHEGIAEVYLGWPVEGDIGVAEVQVKASASIVDFIYVFPQTSSKYGLRAPAFVIRPNGNWSMDCSELPRGQKQPFGAEGDSGRLLPNRKGIFEYDYTVRAFRHGYEDHPRKKAQQASRWW